MAANIVMAENAADLAELHLREAERLAGIDAVEAERHKAEYQRYLQLETDYAADSSSRQVKARSYRNRAEFERANGSPKASILLYEKSLEYMDEGVSSHQYLIPSTRKRFGSSVEQLMPGKTSRMSSTGAARSVPLARKQSRDSTWDSCYSRRSFTTRAVTSSPRRTNSPGPFSYMRRSASGKGSARLPSTCSR